MQRRHGPIIVAVSVTMAFCGTALVRAQSAVAQRRLEAAVVSKFPQFVEWPAAALTGRSTLDLCVATPDPFGPDLDELVANEAVNGRTIAVRRLDRNDDVAGCHILFVSPVPGGARPPLLQRAAALPILTISDDERFLDVGGIIRLRLVNGRMRFDVDARAAQRVGLRISSQLLQLAVTVRGAS